MEHRVRINLLSVAIVIAVGFAVSLITSTVVASRAYRSRVRQLEQARQEVMVKGYARRRVRSDTAVWQIDVSGEGETLAAAFAELESAQASVQGFLSEQGFSDGEIAMGAIGTETHYARDDGGRQTRQVAAYVLDRTFTVTSRDVDRVARVAGEVTRLLKDNVRVVSGRPKFTIGDLGPIKVQVIGEASADARIRAEEMASKAGCRVGAVRSAHTGVMQITEPESTSVSGAGIYDTSTIDKDVSVVVTVTFGVQ